jgi:hypothetical protein
MIRQTPRLLAAMLAGTAIAVLAGCAGGAQRPSANVATVNACRSLVDSAYDRQNRADQYRESQRDTPFASSGTPSVTTAGLGERYGRDTDVANCVRGSAANVTGVGTGAPETNVTVVRTPN